jgi:excisionase family DNA binding protein
MNKLLLTPEEAAEVLSVGRTKLYQLISDGTLRSVRIDKSRRVPMSALVELVQRLDGKLEDDVSLADTAEPRSEALAESAHRRRTMAGLFARGRASAEPLRREPA